jgi:hypothetical protein
MELEPDPDNPRDYESRLSINLVFRYNVKGDVFFSAAACIQNLIILLIVFLKRSARMITSHIPRTCQLPYISNSKLHMFPLNSVIFSFLKFKLGINSTVIVIIFSSLYALIGMYLFRNMLFTLRLSKYINALSALFLIFPLEHIVQQALASRDSLMLIFIFAAVIQYQLGKPILLNVSLLLASLTGPQGAVLFIGFIFGFFFTKKQWQGLLTTCTFILAAFLSREIGFNHFTGGLLPKFKEFAASISTHREAEGIIQMIIIPLFGALTSFNISKPIMINALLLIIISLYGPTANGMRTAAIAQIISFAGLSFAMSPRIKNGVYTASVFFLVPLIYIAVCRITTIREELEHIE